MLILLLDPDSSTALLIASALDASFGRLRIELASSALEALQAVARERPDVVIAAHPMPALGGIGLTAMLKSRPNPPVIVVVTSASAIGLDLQCRAAGVDLLLEKRHLQSRLLAFLQRRFPKAWADGTLTRRQAACARVFSSGR